MREALRGCISLIPGGGFEMQTKRFLRTGLRGMAILCGIALISGTAWAQDSSSVNQAFQVARQAVNPEIQTKVVSLYGIGTPTAIQKWYIIFYDPSVASHGRAVLVENKQITKTYPANGGTIYSVKLAFDPSRITSEVLALNAAQNYATQHNIAYDSVHALLKQTSIDKPFRWRVELVNSGKSRGFVYVNALDDTVAYYEAPSSRKGGSSSSSSDDGMKGFANDVQKTFLGVGGDLEEIFTGDRTVDK
jgi:hypothetical protein